MRALDALADGRVREENPPEPSRCSGRWQSSDRPREASTRPWGGTLRGLGLDWLITVGNEAGRTASAARDAGMPAERVLELARTGEAVRIVERAREGR